MAMAGLQQYPNNVRILDFLYFLCAPTLVYDLNYPRSRSIRKMYIVRRLLELVCGLGSIPHSQCTEASWGCIPHCTPTQEISIALAQHVRVHGLLSHLFPPLHHPRESHWNHFPLAVHHCEYHDYYRGAIHGTLGAKCHWCFPRGGCHQHCRANPEIGCPQFVFLALWFVG